MAYVAISASLSSDVRSNIRRLKMAEIAQFNTDTAVSDAVSNKVVQDKVIDLMWPAELEDLRPRLCGYTRNAGVRFRIEYDGGEIKRTEETSLNLNIPSLIKNSDGSFDRYSFVKAPLIRKGFHELVDDAIEALEQRWEASTRWGKVEEDIAKFLNGCKSLNEALKLWPDVEKFIPNEYLKRVAEKKEKSKSESAAAGILKGMDLDQINTSTVLARMAGTALK